MDKILFREEIYQIVGAAMDVYKYLGSGFLEAVYQEALEVEFNNRLISFEKQKLMNINYKGKKLNKEYIADFFCFHEIIVEIKALNNTSDKDISQLINYLKSSGLKLGLLVNFGRPNGLEWKRIIR